MTFYAGPGLTNPIGSPVNVVSGSATSAATTTLPVGADTITAVYSGGAGFAGSQGTETVTVTSGSTTVNLNLVDINSDAANVAIYDGGVQRSMVNSVVYHFNTAVNLSANAVTTVTLHPSITVSQTGHTTTTGTVGTIPDADTLSTPDGGFTWVVTFGGAGVTPGGSIADGVYDITLNAADVTTASGGGAVALNDYNGGTGGTGNDAETFWCLYGDARRPKGRRTRTFRYSPRLTCNARPAPVTSRGLMTTPIAGSRLPTLVCLPTTT